MSNSAKESNDPSLRAPASMDDILALSPLVETLRAVSFVRGGICLIEPESLQFPASCSYSREQLLQRALFHAGHTSRVIFVPFKHAVWSGLVLYNTGVPDLMEGLYSVAFGSDAMSDIVAPVIAQHAQCM
jgi:hypothetical protein